MDHPTGPNILITGLPRSGTTLTCHLLNKVPNSVALHEPMTPQTLAKLSTNDMIAAINLFCATQRAQVLTTGMADSKSWNGTVPSNPRADKDVAGQRASIMNGTKITVQTGITDAFALFIKHPAFFTAALADLTPAFSCFAIMRNPLAVLLSWRSAGMAVTNGRMPAAENYAPLLKAALDAEPDVLERQFLLLDFCFAQYRRYLPGRTLKYEDMIASSGRALSLFHPAAAQLDEPLQSRNTLGLQTDQDAQDIGRRLLDRDLACWSFYSPADVRQLLGQTADPA